VIATSVVACYAERFENTVVYLQNAADAGHVCDQLAPFLAAIDLAHHRRLLARLGYWGQGGHAQPPASEWLAWLKAAIASPSSDAEDIQRTRKEHPHLAAEPPKPLPDQQDVRLAAAFVEQIRASNVETGVSAPK
jgi:hypothetical protein